MKSCSMLLRVARAVSEAQINLVREESLAKVNLSTAVGPAAVKLAEEMVRHWRTPRNRERFIVRFVTGKVEKYFADRYIREARKTGDDTDVMVVAEYAREEAARVLQNLL